MALTTGWEGAGQPVKARVKLRGRAGEGLPQCFSPSILQRSMRALFPKGSPQYIPLLAPRASTSPV